MPTKSNINDELKPKLDVSSKALKWVSRSVKIAFAVVGVYINDKDRSEATIYNKTFREKIKFFFIYLSMLLFVLTETLYILGPPLLGNTSSLTYLMRDRDGFHLFRHSI